MPAYLVTLDRNKCGHQLRGDGDAMVVFAADATAAKEICAAKYPGDGLAWANDSTVTQIVQDADFNGWTLRVFIQSGLGDGSESGEFIVTGDATNNTIDEVAALMVTALNAHADIAGAAYNATSQTLKVAETTDGLGDQTIEVTLTPPGGESAIPSLIGTITDGGASGDALTVVLPADAAVIPIVTAVVKQVD